MTQIVGESPPVSRPSGATDARRETTTIGAVAGRPSSTRIRLTAESSDIGPYPSAAAVPAPTRTASASARSTRKTARSPGDCRPRLRPATVVAPSREAMKLTRSARPGGSR